MNTAMADSSAWQSLIPRLCLWLVLPLFAVAYQICARKAAACGLDPADAGAWMGCVLRNPWTGAMVASDVGSFAAWMLVLREMDLSAAFPMSALSYVLVIVASWTVFREPGGVAQVMGSASIMAGVFLMGRADAVER